MASIEYSNAPIGALIEIEPTGEAHVGCVLAAAVGAEGAPAEAVMIMLAPFEIQVLSLILRTDKL
jgi:hypothetical protein